MKWTDRWAERPPENCTASEGINKWGEKWEERFESGKGSKRGESWSEDSNGHRYDRWWGENHFGDGFVQKFGHSTDGKIVMCTCELCLLFIGLSLQLV